MNKRTNNNSHSESENSKSLESWIWDAACSIRGVKEAPKFKDYILPLIFAKRLCDVFDDVGNEAPKQTKITQTLSTIRQKVDNAQIEKAKLQALFRTILYDLMTAETRVREFEITA